MQSECGTEERGGSSRAAHGSAADWIPLTMDNTPPEGVRFWVMLGNGCEHYATRVGNAIHVGVPDSFRPNAVAWRPDEESPNAEVSDGGRNASELEQDANRRSLH